MRRLTSSWSATMARLGFTKSRRRALTQQRMRQSYSRLSRIEPLEVRLALTWGYETLIDNGPVDNRIDMVFLGDGFVLSDSNYNNTVDYYADRVGDVTEEFYLAAPFDEYASYFNVHRVDVISNEAGISNPMANPPVYVDTALGGFLNAPSGPNNFLMVGETAVLNAAADAPD